MRQWVVWVDRFKDYYANLMQNETSEIGHALTVYFPLLPKKTSRCDLFAREKLIVCSSRSPIENLLTKEGNISKRWWIKKSALELEDLKRHTWNKQTPKMMVFRGSEPCWQKNFRVFRTNQDTNFVVASVKILKALVYEVSGKKLSGRSRKTFFKNN